MKIHLRQESKTGKSRGGNHAIYFSTKKLPTEELTIPLNARMFSSHDMNT